MTTRKTELPGVGTKFTLELATGDELVAVEHRLGHWELARTDEDGEATSLVVLQPREASELGRILSSGEEAEEEDTRMQLLFEQFCIEWVVLEDDSPLVGQTLQEANIRQHTGASVMAVLRPEVSIPSPAPDTCFEAADTLIVIGHREQVEEFRKQYAPVPADG